MWLILDSKIETTKPLIYKCVLLMLSFLGNDGSQDWSFRSPLTCRFQLTKGPKSDNLLRVLFGLKIMNTQPEDAKNCQVWLMEIMFHCQFVFGVCLTSNEFKKRHRRRWISRDPTCSLIVGGRDANPSKRNSRFHRPKDGTTESRTFILRETEISLFRNWKLSDGKMSGFVQCFFTCHHNFR